ncbi:MAG TPA: hypothetical protein DCG24_06900 [Bacteroidetes bacterium]|nr:hypothetical protein [Bacteroidota bacterium]
MQNNLYLVSGNRFLKPVFGLLEAVAGFLLTILMVGYEEITLFLYEADYGSIVYDLQAVRLKQVGAVH